MCPDLLWPQSKMCRPARLGTCSVCLRGAVPLLPARALSLLPNDLSRIALCIFGVGVNFLSQDKFEGGDGLAVWPWANYLTSLSFSFIAYEPCIRFLQLL